MWNRIKNFVLVTLVTCIIWVFAESESLRPIQVPSVEITILPELGQPYTVEIAQDSPGIHGNVVRADLSLEGPTAALDIVQRRLRQPIVVNPGMKGFSSEPGRRPLDLQAVLRDHPELHLAGRGVSIKSISPESVDVTIEQLVTKSVKIDVDLPTGTELDGTAELKVSTASVVLPQSQASKIGDNTAFIARIDPAALARLNPGARRPSRRCACIPRPNWPRFSGSRLIRRQWTCRSRCGPRPLRSRSPPYQCTSVSPRAS